MNAAEEAALRAELVELQQQHRDLDDSITALQAMPSPDQIQIIRLKKNKLKLRDRIQDIEDKLFPDLIA